MKILKAEKGFTLIELLIVIALLGTLAVALLAAIDPFEQFKKGTDTGIRNTVQEMYNASIRYYAQRSGWPLDWGVTPTVQITTLLTSDPTKWVYPLINAGELKSNFTELAADQLGKITLNVLDSKLMVCFKPEAKSFQGADKNTKFTSSGFDTNGNAITDNTTTPTCKLNTATGTDCFWCIY